jgi:hypothetical protein
MCRWQLERRAPPVGQLEAEERPDRDLEVEASHRAEVRERRIDRRGVGPSEHLLAEHGVDVGQAVCHDGGLNPRRVRPRAAVQEAAGARRPVDYRR